MLEGKKTNHLKVACTSGPFSSKIINGYPIFCERTIYHQVNLVYE